ncbi:MAG: DUF1385 domain-containing protein [Ruminococcus sp.]|nr:DUF1385 domain-containing protein [Ruminococcus sp.]
MSKKEKSKEKFKSRIGGQALIEGIMMRGISKCAMACRLPSGEIDVEVWDIKNGKDAPWYRKVPFIRGTFNFLYSMIEGYQCMMKSIDKQDFDEENEKKGKLEEWIDSKLEKCDDKKVMAVVSALTVILSLGLTLVLFKFVPMLMSSLLGKLGAPDVVKTVSEGVLRLVILISYMKIVSLTGTMKTTFMYHGAEHKTIACYEHGEELTVENVRKHTRFHKRCGTSFLLITVLIAIIVGMFLTWENIWIRLGMQLLLVPVEASVAYEIIKLAGRYDNFFTAILSAPGLWLQRITTYEPTDAQIECAIAAIKPCIPDDSEEDKW